ncbi:helix-turn-helix transcriptional regulator [Acetobacter estunensis]|uniref:helix-turn-helix domain-containing protein n=1 Tax=Acetobacter estunensis TaxID=104097 RepID=UPI001C2D61B1|nr:helix-turn-helix transcriptional regulator [Acetobacter estunensis]MBV1837234.1 helix-turn-helix transcriptional regulator [Acetobacter estunensis]
MTISNRRYALARTIWDTIDHMAAEHGLTPSGLARAAGLDPTALNPSRRLSHDGHIRLPRMETLLDLLDATGLSLTDFASLTLGMTHPSAPTPHAENRLRLRILPLSALDATGLFNRAGLPVGPDWLDVSSPFAEIGPNDYGVRLDTDAAEPLFRSESLLLVSPDSPIRADDRVLVRGTEIFPGIAGLRTGHGQEVRKIGQDAVFIQPAETWIHRIIAATC